MNEIRQLADSIPLADGCTIAAVHPSGLVAISKGEGKASHPNPDGKKCSPMIKAPYDFDGEFFILGCGGQTKLWLINRLDSPTSGIVLLGFDEDVAKAAKDAFREHKVKKIYRAICVGQPPSRSGFWRDTLFERKLAGFVRSGASRAGSASAKRAESKFFVEGFDKNNYATCLIRLEPLTGLTHQLRVQCAKHNVPILGDATYGNFNANRKIRNLSKIDRLFLHCSETALNLQTPAGKIDFRAAAPLPDSFKKILGYNK